ncbi:MAG: hypothetical protein ACK559_39095, partial [bacterium]
MYVKRVADPASPKFRDDTRRGRCDPVQDKPGRKRPRSGQRHVRGVRQPPDAVYQAVGELRRLLVAKGPMRK